MKSLVSACLLFGTALAVADEAERIVLRNDRLTLVLGRAEKGAIISLVDRATGQEFIAPQSSPKLFGLTFSEEGDVSGERVTLSSQEATAFNARIEEQPGRAAATLIFDGLGEIPIHVVCTVCTNASDPVVRWRLYVQIPDSLVLEEVQFPICVLRVPLGEDGADDAAVIGRTKGGVIREPGKMKIGSRLSARQPGSLAAQFACYYDQRVGFYTAAYDGKGYPKDFEMRRVKEGIEVDWNPHCFTAEPYALDFDIVMTTFTGVEKGVPTDWRDAADIYKAWALTQPWCAETYARRKDIPDWMKSGPAMVRFTRAWLAKPSRIEKWLKEYWGRFFRDIPLITAYWGWEKVNTWVTPDYFPVYPSDREFADLVARSRKLGCHAFLWPSGYHWTLTYRKQPDGSFWWDDRKCFDLVARPHAVHNRSGEVYHSARSWLEGGETSCMCPGDSWTRAWWNTEVAAPIVQRGVEMIQVDQVVGGGFPFCYSRNHGHPPGPGRWMTETFSEQLRMVYAECRRIEPDLVLGFEEPNEQFNHLVGIQDYRDCESTGELASVYNYLYHEFLPTFQSNPHAGDLIGMAYCLVTGQIPHMVPSMRIGGRSAIFNDDFEEWTGQSFLGWDQVKSYQGVLWNGRFYRDIVEKHSGEASIRLENATDEDIVQVSQNLAVDEGVRAGKKYRFSAWMKTGHLSGKGSINLGAFTRDRRWVSVGTIPMPPAKVGWTLCTTEFSMPSLAVILRIMIHVVGKAQVWVDDLGLDEIVPGEQPKPAIHSGMPAGHKLMKQWVDLFHGDGRPYLLFGQMLRPPKLDCAAITYKNHRLPAILHNAFRAPDGSVAVILANPTPQVQTGTLSWAGGFLRLELQPEEVRLIR